MTWPFLSLSFPDDLTSRAHSSGSSTTMACLARGPNPLKDSAFISSGTQHLTGKLGSTPSNSSRSYGLKVSAKGKGGGRRSNTSNRPGGQPSMCVASVSLTGVQSIHL